MFLNKLVVDYIIIFIYIIIVMISTMIKTIVFDDILFFSFIHPSLHDDPHCELCSDGKFYLPDPL